MERPKSLPAWMLGFLALNLYINGLPRLFQFEILHWFAYWAGFFVLAFGIARFLLGLKGIQAFGLRKQAGWKRQLALGFALGAGLWGCKYLALWAMGAFSLGGMRDTSFILILMGQALLAMFFAALLNDISIRGYWLALCRQRGWMGSFLLLATLLYCLDDAWNEGFSLINTLFSAVLGLGLAYAVYKTGALWLCTGIHWGGNMAYRAMYGFDGQGVWQLQGVQDSQHYDWISLLITALLLPVLYVLLIRTKPASQPATNKAGVA